VASSQLLDHTGLARATEQSFRQWWHRWLEREGWALQNERAVWPREQASAPALIPLANSPSRRLPLWLGPLEPQQRQALESEGHELMALPALEPWGGLAELFHAQEQGRRVLVQLEGGDPEGIQRQLWQQVYPQLVWQLMETASR